MTTVQLVVLITLGVLSMLVFFSQNFMLMKYIPPEKTPGQNWHFVGGFVCYLTLYFLLWSVVAQNNELTGKTPPTQYERVQEPLYRLKQ